MPYDIQSAKSCGGVLVGEANGVLHTPVYDDTLSYRTVGKRALDLVLVLCGAFVVLPLILVMAALVAMDGHSPFYTQKRIGRGGKVFRILKMRTMIPNAERILQERLAEDPKLNAEWSATQKLKNDFRITRIGRLLRKTSMDELPQLWNVLTGSMSLVGPRPMMPEQEVLYPGVLYYSYKPGITGLWQISKRNDCNFRDRATFDDEYDRTVSLWTDMKVLWRTVHVVLRGTGH